MTGVQPGVSYQIAPHLDTSPGNFPQLELSSRELFSPAGTSPGVRCELSKGITGTFLGGPPLLFQTVSPFGLALRQF